MKEEIPPRYDHKETEEKTYRLWEESGYFNPNKCVEDKITNEDADTFSIVLPPPNVTGNLHMGHAAMLVVEDIMVRYARMRGKRTLWVPGTDHAAIATQSKVESILYKEEKKTRYDLGREAFLERVTKFAAESHDIIVHQVQRLGASLDWSREAYTLDEKRTLAVRTAFKTMYDMGLIYRGNRIVNWDPAMQTTVSDDEVEWTEETVPLYYLKYGPFEIATARPETKFGDKYVVMHPDDLRYAKYIHGQTIELEWINGPITATVIKDPAIDMTFGTGVMTITPWHDTADFGIAERHKLAMEPIIDLHGKLLPIAGEFEGQHIKKARPLIAEKLKTKGLLSKTEEKYTHRVATNSRGGGVIEPQILKQWFVDVNKPFHSPDPKAPKGTARTLKEWMRDVVNDGKIVILPNHFVATYNHWIENLHDWCISRQIWFGHRIPAWYCGGREKTEHLSMGFAGDVVPQVFDGKTKTYRLRNHNFKVGDKVFFENSTTRTFFGYGIMTQVQETTVEQIDFRDPTHYITYNNLGELLAAFKLRNPEKNFTEKSKAYLYAYEFHPFGETEKETGCAQLIVSEAAPKTCPACGSNNLEQDPDTLDTWFSSGLWPFSALGWPEETSDLKTYFPNTILETGYDILFFWVARMILMAGALLGNIPFRKAYLHGLVRDVRGKKMSKTAGNGIDPLLMADTYGADATRLSLIIGAAPGNDIKLSEDKIRGYRNFSTKIWNVGRFILMHKPEGLASDPPLSRDEQTYLEGCAAIKKEVTKHIEQYNFHLAGEAAYHYLWHTLADKVVEAKKEALRGEDAAKKAAAYHTLETIFLECLRMLHPFMPFITETLWQKFRPGTMLMVEPWEASSENLESRIENRVE